MYNLSGPSEQMSESDKVGNVKNNPPNEKLEITVKTFFGYEITVIEKDGDYKVKSTGIKGLGDKILWFFFAPTLKSRKAAVQKTLENNNSQVNIDNSNKENTFNDLVNSEIEQVKSNFVLSDKECNEIRERIDTCVKNGLKESSIIKETINQFVTEKFGKQDVNGNINSKGSIKSDSKMNENVDNEFSVFKNENNNINSGEGEFSAINYANDMAYDNFDLSEQELKDLDNEIKDLELQENQVQSYKKNRIAEIKKRKKEKAEDQQQLEKTVKQSKSERENVEKKYKEAESNLEKMIPNGYRVTSFDKGDGIIGDGNCFYRAIAKLENGNQEGYSEIRKTISDEINKSVELVGKSDYKIDDNLLTLIQLYAGEYSELKSVEIHKNNLDVSLLQIREHVEGKDKKNEYAGPIEAYFYAKATKKVVIIYDSNDQISVFIPDKDGNNVHVEHTTPDKVKNYIEENNIDISNAVKLAYNAAGKHYEAVVPVGVDN